MKTHHPFLLALSLATPVTACSPPAGTDGSTDGPGSGSEGTTSSSDTTGAGGDCADPNDPDAPRMGISEDITEDRTLSCGTIWVLEKIVFVRGATLTVEPGTTITGLSGSALVIDVDATLDAQGTAEAPIVMTSNQPAGSRNRGDWGGLVLLGRAPVNLAGGSGQAEGFANPPTYGGDDPTHDCGTLSYLRVEFAGFEISPGSELNGITFYACGTGTTVHHVQSHMGADDGIEFFGGGFDLKYVVVTGAADDSLDMDQGFTGTVQYAFLQQDPALGDNGLEISNQGSDFLAQPRTAPVLANLTLLGSGPTGEKSKGATFKEGTEAYIYNSILVRVTNETFLLAHPETQTVAEGGGLVLQNLLFFGNGTPPFATTDGAGWDDAAFADFVLAPENGNLDGVDPKLGSTAWGMPDPSPAANSPVAGAGRDPGKAGIEPTGYIGAVEPGAVTPWTEGWTNFSPN